MTPSIPGSRHPSAPWLAVCLVAMLAGGPTSALAHAPEPGDELVVRLVTISPGEAAVSRFGHTALWIEDRVAGTSLAYGFGLSDFRRPGFLYQLLEGRVEAWGDAIDAGQMLDLYRGQDRRISVQTLNLSPSQRLALKDLVEREIRDENTFFNYDLFRANCTTAVRDIIDEALGGRLDAATSGIPSGETFRSLASPYTASDLPLHTFITLFVVNSVDRPIDRWEAMFLPDTLRDRLRNTTIEDPSGRQVPLVAREEVVYQPDHEPALASVGGLWARYLAIGAVVGVSLALLGRAAGRREAGWAVRGFELAAGGWILVTGLLGVLLITLWAFTGQTLTYWNMNVLQANPLLLLVGISAWGSRSDRGRAAKLAWLVAGIGVVGLLLQAVPWIPVPRPPHVALFLPAHLGLAWGFWRWCDGTRRLLKKGAF